MKLAISNIGWEAPNDIYVYDLMKKYGYSGLEIAPTRIFPQHPYDKLAEAELWSRKLKKEYGFTIPSMQSIWYGRQEMLFGTAEEREILVNYTKRAIHFSAAIGCKNLVFGCPKNRYIPEGVDARIGVSFFKEIGDYAAENNTVIGVEANPAIYSTNYINDTLSALDLIHEVGLEGFKLNLDVGTMIENNEDVSLLVGKVGLINHVHISEPGLKSIKERALHKNLKSVLAEGKYDGYVSIEMGKTDDLSLIEDKLHYVRECFDGL